MKRPLMIIVVLVLMAAPGLDARNVDLVTLPRRDSVQLTIYNSADITMAKETRHITLTKGVNRLQFSWANTLIDPTSVEIRPIEHADEIEIIDTILPAQKPQHLIWNIESEYEGQVAMEVSYFTSGLTWSMDYVAVTDPEETEMQFDGYVQVFNNSGEEYEDAEIRLIVGTINLVEKIRDLATRRGVPVPEMGSREHERMRRDVYADSVGLVSQGGGGGSAPAEIVKEGLSEYFMFTVQGRETIPNGWSKRMQAVDAPGVTFDIVYRMRAHQYGPRPVRFFIWNNDQEHQLGESPLPDGRVNVFRDNGTDGLSFLGQQIVRYVPIQADIEINLGPDDLVIYDTERMSVERSEFRYHRRNGQDYVNGWDERTRWVDTVRNYRGEPITFELHRQWHGDVDYESEVETTLFDYHTTVTTFVVSPRVTVDYPATVTVHHGANKGQEHVDLKS